MGSKRDKMLWEAVMLHLEGLDDSGDFSKDETVGSRREWVTLHNALAKKVGETKW